MMEVAGLAIAVMPLFVNIMDTVKIAMSISHQEKNISISLTKLYVERARLGEFARILGLVSESFTGLTLDSADVAIVQRIMTSTQEKLVETQLLMQRHGFRRNMVWAQQDKSRFPGLIHQLTELNDSLYRYVVLYNFQEQRKARSMLTSAEDNSTKESRSSTDSLVYDLWNSSVHALQMFGNTILKSSVLRRTFQRAAVRLDIWQDGFDFKLGQIESVLGTNEYLYEAIVVVLARLIYLLWHLVIAATEHVELPVELRRFTGRTLERIKLAALEMEFSIDDVDGSDYHLEYKVLFCNQPGNDEFEDLVFSIRNQVNGHCAVLFELIGAIDRARKRHLWLIDIGKKSRASTAGTPQGTQSQIPQTLNLPDYRQGHREKPLTKQQTPVSACVEEILETDSNHMSESASTTSHKTESLQVTHRVPARQLLSDNVEIATTLYQHLQKKNFEEKPAEDPSMPKPRIVPQLEQDVQAELTRLKKFMDDVGTELDGSLAQRNKQIEEAVTFTLEHMNHVLNQALDREKLQRHPSWTKISGARHQELIKAHQIEDSASAVADWNLINDSLAALIEPIKIEKSLPAYQPKPVPGELTIMRSSLQISRAWRRTT